MERYGRTETDIVVIHEEERHKPTEIFLVCQNMSCSELIIGLYLVVREGNQTEESGVHICALFVRNMKQAGYGECQQRMKTVSFTEMLRWLIDWILCDREIREVILACAAGP